MAYSVGIFIKIKDSNKEEKKAIVILILKSIQRIILSVL